MLIKEWLEKENISGKDFAKALDLHPTYFYNIIECKQRTSKKIAKKIEMMTNGEVTADEMLSFEVLPKTNKKETITNQDTLVTITLKEYLYLKEKAEGK